MTFSKDLSPLLKQNIYVFKESTYILEICFKIFLNDLLGIVQIVGGKGHELIIVVAGRCTTQLKRMNAPFHNKKLNQNTLQVGKFPLVQLFSLKLPLWRFLALFLLPPPGWPPGMHGFSFTSTFSAPEQGGQNPLPLLAFVR